MSLLTRFFQIMSTNNAVKALFGANPVRIYPYGVVLDKVPPKSYALYSLFNATPYNYLSGRCDMDLSSLQVDIYADNSALAIDCFEAVRTALEAAQGYLINFSTPARDIENGFYRVSMEIDFHEER